MSEYDTLQGILVRKERQRIYIIWTQELNIVYVREENLDASKFSRGDLVYVDVFKKERRKCQYRFEGRNCQMANGNAWSPGWRQFSPCHCPGNEDRDTVMWQGDFEMTGFERGEIIRSVNMSSKELPFIKGAWINGPQRESILKAGNMYFKASVILDYSPEYDNKYPWKVESIIIEAAEKPKKSERNAVKEESRVEDFDVPLISSVRRDCAYLSSTIENLERKQRRQLNAGLIASKFLEQGSSILMPSPSSLMCTSQLYGFCLFSDFTHHIFYCSTDGGNADCYGSPLKLSPKLPLQVGSWYRMCYKGPEKLSRMNVDRVASPDYFSNVIECEEPYDELIVHVLPNSGFVNTIILRAYLQFQPDFKFFAKYLAMLFDNNDVMHVAVTEYLETHSTDQVCFIVEVTPHIELGFVVTRCLGIDEGCKLADYLQRSKLGRSVFVDDSMHENQEDSFSLGVKSGQQGIIEKSSQDDLGKNGDLSFEQQTPIGNARCTGAISAVISTSAVSNVVSMLLSDKLNTVIKEEGLSSELENLMHCMAAGTNNMSAEYQQPVPSSEDNLGPCPSKVFNEHAVQTVKTHIANTSSGGYLEAKCLKNVLLGLCSIKNIIKEAGELETMDQMIECVKSSL